MVSGTASIEPGGKTAFVGDIEKQVDLTMRVISAILESRGMGLSDTVRSVAYCLRPEYYEVFKKWMARAKLDIPHCPSYSIVCRGDLLFEVELEAFAKKKLHEKFHFGRHSTTCQPIFPKSALPHAMRFFCVSAH